MAKQPAFQFYTGDWLKDPNLSMCSEATRGIWMDLLCAMHENDRKGVIAGTPEQLARLCRCSAVNFDHAIDELQSTNTAGVTDRHGKITVTCRRMRRESEEREKANVRKKRQRKGMNKKDNVTVPSRESHVTPSSSSSTSTSVLKKPSKKNRPPGTASEIALEVWEYEGFSAIWPRCGDGWNHAGEIDFAAKAAETSVERFLAMLWQKAQVPKLNNPAAAAISAFRKGWSPTDGALEQVKALLYPDEGEREGLYIPDMARNDFRESSEYQEALQVFRRLKGVFANQGITCVEELMLTKEWADMRSK